MFCCNEMHIECLRSVWIEFSVAFANAMNEVKIRLNEWLINYEIYDYF